MKFSTIATTAFAAIIATASADYVCHIDEFYTTNNDVPLSKDAQDFVAQVTIDTFNEAYASLHDIHMISDVLDDDDFEMSYTAEGMLGRRGRRHGSTGGWGCNWCRDDDATALGEASFSAVEFGDALSTSKEHQLWENLFCEKVRANDELKGIRNCKFTLSNCHTEDPELSTIPPVIDESPSADYVCHIDEFYTTKNDAPLSKDAKDFVAQVTIDTFNEAYASLNDIHMVSDNIDDDDFETAPTAASFLRGAKSTDDEGVLGRRGRRGNRHGSTGGWGCNWCRDDDATALLFSAVDFGDALSASKEHQLWENLFCEKARANDELNGIRDCKFILSNCHNKDPDLSTIPPVTDEIATE